MKLIPGVALSIVLAAAPDAHAQYAGGAVTPLAAAAQEVQIGSGGITLSGTLLRPPRPFAAVVLVHGSGQGERMLGLARELAAHGVAVLTYDKRGVGRSGGVYAGPEVGTNNVDPANLALLAGDASAAARELVRRLSPAETPLGLIGFSQGGWIVPLAALRTPQVKFMILSSGPVVTTLEQLRFQFLTGGQPDWWDQHSEAEARTHIRSDPDRFPFVATDTASALRTLSISGAVALWRPRCQCSGGAVHRAPRRPRRPRQALRAPAVSAGRPRYSGRSGHSRAPGLVGGNPILLHETTGPAALMLA